jgi:rhomboid-like protein
MNSLWPVASRLSSLAPKPSRCGRDLDGLKARLLQTAVRTYSGRCSPLRAQIGLSHQTGPHSLSPLSAFKTLNPIRTYATSRIITEYEDLPKDYTDEHGLKFRNKPLSQAEVLEVFGPGIDAATANRVLRVLHGRRVAGTLDEPSTMSLGSAFEQELKEKALAWLRSRIPVDEQDSAGKYAEEELARMEQEMIADSERIGIYKPNAGDPRLKTRQELYGESGLDAIRVASEAKLDEKDKKVEGMDQAAEVHYNTGTLELTNSRGELVNERGVVLRRPGQNPKLKYYEERSRVLPSQPAPMPTMKRLLLPAILVLATIGISVLLASVYVPPSHTARLWKDMPPAAATIISIIIANSIVFCAWRVPPAWRTLNKYFIVAPGYPFSFSMIGNFFSHQQIKHFATNMVLLWFAGTRLHDEIGRGNFMAVYMTSGVLASFTSLAYFTATSNFVITSLGASGAIAGVLATYLWLNRDHQFKLLGLPPDPYNGIHGWAILALIVGYEVLGAYRGFAKIGQLDRWSHLGGYVAGIGCAEVLRRRSENRKRLEEARRKDAGYMQSIRERRI